MHLPEVATRGLHLAKSWRRHRRATRVRLWNRSPLICDLARAVMLEDPWRDEFDVIERVRSSMLHSARIGPSARKDMNPQRSLRSMARYDATPPKYGRLLFRLMEYFRPGNVLELGTSLGFGTLYLASPDPNARVVTIERDATLAGHAKTNFETCGIDNVEIIVGDFDNALPAALARLDVVDAAYVDGNHRMVPTLAYFARLKARAHCDTVLIFDDIHWSAEMSAAWESIKADPDVSVTLDLFRMGIALFKPVLVKQDFAIRI